LVDRTKKGKGGESQAKNLRANMGSDTGGATWSPYLGILEKGGGTPGDRVGGRARGAQGSPLIEGDPIGEGEYARAKIYGGRTLGLIYSSLPGFRLRGGWFPTGTRERGRGVERKEHKKVQR